MRANLQKGWAMNKVMFAWVGMNDLRAARENAPEKLGPIARAVTELGFSRVMLLNNYGKDENVPAYLDWLKTKSQASIDLVHVNLPSPIDFAAIYIAAKKQVERILQNHPGQVVPVFHLSPGTPAMAAVWIMLAKGPIAEAELIQSSRERGVEVVDMPFNIFTEFIPDVSRGADRRLLLCSESRYPAITEFGNIIHRCPAMQMLVAQARLVARRNVPVLLEGETGTGKELFARAIHKESSRASGAFVAVNCGAVPQELFEAEFFGYKKGAFTGAVKDHPGYFEQADGGTLFLDELGELPPAGQVKILRVLNDGMVRRLNDNAERKADVRVIGATNRNLIKEVSAGHFRADLFYRLAVAVLKLPPLREREGDLHLLLESLLEQVNEVLAKEPDYVHKKFSINAKNLMVRHDWPGNVRELHNTILRICVWCQGAIIQEEDVCQALLPTMSQDDGDILNRPLGDAFKLQEIIGYIASVYIRKALSETSGNKSKAAKLLGFKNYQTLNNWMEKYGVEG
jgi:DNA-binding NtrC family response regulator